VHVSVTLLPASIKKVERWKRNAGMATFSEAVREMIDFATDALTSGT
jgi:hypothetical protein